MFLEGKQKRQSSGKNKKKKNSVYKGGGGVKNMSAFWGQRSIVEKQRARELETRPDSCIVSAEGRGGEGEGSCPRLID